MLGALIGAGANLVGSAINKLNVGKQSAMQEKFAKNAIQWKAADAEKAGISKLYALGANTTSYSPVSVGGIGGGIADAGQNIGRAISATQSPLGRAGVLATEIAQTQLEGLKVDNDIKREELLSKLATRTQAGQPPAVLDSETTPVVPGQGNSAIKLRVEKRLSPAGEYPHKSFGVSPEVDMYRTKYGYSPEVPEALGEAQESQPMAAAQWFMRNKLMPALSDAYKTFPYDPPEGSYWEFNPVLGEYTLKKGRSRSQSWEHIMERLRR